MRTFLAIFLLVCAGCVQRPPSVPGPPPATAASPREMDVLVSYLQNLYGKHVSQRAPLVLSATFSLRYFDSSYASFARSLRAQASEGVPLDLIQDFCEKNRISSRVWPEIAARLPVRFLSTAEQRALFSALPGQNPDGWERFYARYPHSPGIVTVSRVGFNRAGDRALVYLGSSSGWLAGHGGMHLLRRKNGHWVEEPTIVGSAWES